MNGGFRSTWDFIDILDAWLKIFKIPHYGFTMLSLDLTLSHTCISYVSGKFPGKDLLSQCIFFIRYFKGFRDLPKQVMTFDAVKKFLRDQRSKNCEQTAPKVSGGTLHRISNRDLQFALEILDWRFIIIISYDTDVFTHG